MEGDPGRLSCSLAGLEQPRERNGPRWRLQGGGSKCRLPLALPDRLGQESGLILPILNVTHLPGLLEGLNDGHGLICSAHHNTLTQTEWLTEQNFPALHGLEV